MKRISQLIVFTAFMSMTWAQTTGKISGTITGDDGTQLVGANIIVLGIANDLEIDKSQNIVELINCWYWEIINMKSLINNLILYQEKKI